MAKTYTYLDAWNLARKQVSSSTEADHAAAVCNLATNEIWNSWDWREALDDLPPFYLVPSEQDYGAPAVVIPADFMGLREAFIVSTNSEPAYRQELEVIKDLRAISARQRPHAIGYEPSKNVFRLFPRVPDSFVAPTYMVDGIYKKRPTKITAANIQATTLPFDDVFLSVMLDSLKWAAMRIGGDQRAGEVQIRQNGQRVYTGQYGIMKERIEEMAQTEAVDLGNPVIAPKESYPMMRGGGVGSPGIYWY